ncbi:MAG: lytic transglycosylase domain-containing protein, partial [Pseudomonadota bacterium]
MSVSLPFYKNGSVAIQSSFNIQNVILLIDNDRMKKTGLYALSFLFYVASASADVLVDLEDTDEISIMNTQLDHRFTVKIAEPIESKLSNLADATASSNKAIKQLPYHDEVLAAADMTSIEPALIHAVITVESKHNAQAKSHKGAYGLMQLMPATAKRFHVKNRRDVGQNILAGAQYLRELLTLFKGDLKLTLAAYNAGPGAVQKYKNNVPPYRETMHYVPKVLKY